MRSLILELRPGNLAEAGFIPALRTYVAAVQDRSGLVIRLNVSPDLVSLPAPVEDVLYRIAQEAIHNVVKHARAREVTVRISSLLDSVRLEIRDDGIGFDPGARIDGFGLPGMTSRAANLGGSVRVESARDRGTIVTAVLPTAVVGAPGPGRRTTTSPRRG